MTTNFNDAANFKGGLQAYGKYLDYTSGPVLFDDFLGTTISTRFGVNKGSDAATVNFAINAATNGTVRATTGAGAGGTMAVNGVQLHSALNWKASQGSLVFETRLKFSAITNIAVFVGLTDQVASLECPINSAGSADTLTTTATDAVGVMFDTSMTNDYWWLVGVANDVDATAQNSAVAPTADTYETWRVEVSTAGVASFYRNGSPVGTVMSGALTASVALTPVVTAFTRTAASATIDLDYLFTQQTR